MTVPTSTWLLQRKWILVTVSLPILVALWWAFRPEKLWINERVNEPAPFDTSSDPQPILTGRFESEAQPTSGRATIYRTPSGREYLRLNDFTTANRSDGHVALARSDGRDLAQEVAKGDLNSIDFGPLKSHQGDQNYDLPKSADPNQYDAVLIYSDQSHTLYGWAKLEPF
jgi:hypothetical protein